ncbi:choice-of-anchor J domain-containing protein, partial [Porphyromonas sp. COT-052 OH4946]|uniref:choice-of-anchor J domain-containing protein n=1 Tax=Porphyromonas sp. COT-052 OH4946 TaxID=1515618 RepID=UPI000580B174
GTKYVAFRHFNCTDFFWINLDDIEIKANAKRAEVVNEGFESGIPSAWKTIDADGDGNNWTTTPPPGGSSFTAIRGTRAQGTWYQKTVQLPAGTKYVAFRHFNCTDFFWINLDDVVITGDGGSSADYTYTVYRDGTKIKEGLTAT